MIDESKRKLYDQVKRARTGGVRGNVEMSYAKIALKFRLTESHVYYICNPQKRKSSSPLGKRRGIYASDHIWAELRRRAKQHDVSISRAIEMLLYHQDPEPLIPPLTGVEEQEEVLV